MLPRLYSDQQICAACALPSELPGHAEQCSDTSPKAQWLHDQIAQAQNIQHSETLAIWLTEQDFPTNQPPTSWESRAWLVRKIDWLILDVELIQFWNVFNLGGIRTHAWTQYTHLYRVYCAERI